MWGAPARARSGGTRELFSCSLDELNPKDFSILTRIPKMEVEYVEPTQKQRYSIFQNGILDKSSQKVESLSVHCQRRLFFRPDPKTDPFSMSGELLEKGRIGTAVWQGNGGGRKRKPDKGAVQPVFEPKSKSA